MFMPLIIRHPSQANAVSAELGSSAYVKTRSVLFLVYKIQRQKAAPFDSGARYRISDR